LTELQQSTMQLTEVERKREFHRRGPLTEDDESPRQGSYERRSNDRPRQQVNSRWTATAVLSCVTTSRQ